MQKENILAVEKMQQYIADHLCQAITLAQLAKCADYSVSRCSRIFKELTGKSPFDYIRAYRLTQAARLLKDSNVKIIDVAFDFVFDSHEGFTRAFYKEFGVLPLSYKKNTVPLNYFIPYSVLETSKLNANKGEPKMEPTKTIFVQLMERPRRKAIIKRGINAADYFSYCEEVNCDIWGVFESIKEALNEPAGFWLPKKLIKSGTSQYVQGVEVPADYSGIVPEGCELIDLDPCKLLIFQSEPYDDEVFQSEIADVWEQIQKYNPQNYGYEWAPQDAPRYQLCPYGYRGYIEGVPVKELKK